MMRTTTTTTTTNVMATTAALTGLLAAGAAAQSIRHAARIDESGLTIVTEQARGSIDNPPAPQPVGAGIIWHLDDAASITESVALSDTTDESWVGHNLNFERMGHHQTTGTNVPIYEYTPETSPDRVIVASAEDTSLGVLMTAGPGVATVRGFTSAGGNAPIWTYTFPEEYTSAFIRGLDASADGSIVAALAFDQAGSATLLALIDGADGSELDTLPIAGFAQAVELSDDGSRAMITFGATAMIVETAGLTTLHSFAVSGGGGYHRLSRDGTVAAAGGFNLRVFKDNGGVWSEAWTQTQAQNWFGAGLALSANGDTLFVAHYNYATGYVDLTYRVIDLVGQVELAMTTTNGSGALQDTVQGAHASDDGQIFAVASWGTEDNVHPEVQVFDQDLNLIGFIDTPGSPFSIDMTRSGQYVLVGGKAVHANTFGNGSDTYSYQVFAAQCPWDCEDAPNGVVGTSDLLALLAAWGNPGPCDTDGGGVGTSDLLKLLANWGDCP